MLEKLDGSLVVETKVPTRILQLPMAFDDKWNKDAVQRYMKSVRDTAPWLPDNLEFMRRINGLDSIDDVRKSVFATSYMVFGLGDVYLGAPCAVPVDPRHRLVTSKYNPARTFTPEGTVGIGGVYMCIYGMESPGGYQLIGRTVPIFDSYVNVPASKKGGDMPWLLRQFDQVRFYECSEDELVTMRADYVRGELDLKVRTEIFDLKEHEAWLEANKASIEAFQDKQAAAYATEREYWKTFDFSDRTVVDYVPKADPDWAIGFVETLVRGNVWKWLKEENDTVEAGEVVCILEAMKMEIPIKSNSAGVLREKLPEGTMVEPMTKLAYIGK
jgi:urea carboxylase